MLIDNTRDKINYDPGKLKKTFTTARNSILICYNKILRKLQLRHCHIEVLDRTDIFKNTKNLYTVLSSLLIELSNATFFHIAQCFKKSECNIFVSNIAV